MTLLLSDPIYHDENAARSHLESIRWPNGPVCPHCGSVEQIAPLKGKSMGPGWYYCAACKDKFTVRMGAVYERSHIPLHKWLLAFRLMASSKKGISSHQLHRTLGITYKSAWFLAHRIREAMADSDPTPMGGDGKIVESDETFLGTTGYEFNNEKGWTKKRGTGDMKKSLTLVERGGRARSMKMDDLTAKNVTMTVLTHLSTASTLMTDEARHYGRLGKRFAKHETVNHKEEEYVRGEAYTNTVEGFFSIFKRGMK